MSDQVSSNESTPTPSRCSSPSSSIFSTESDSSISSRSTVSNGYRFPSAIKLGWDDEPYRVLDAGIDSQGVRFCKRHYFRPGVVNPYSYNCTFADGSYYYTNPDGSQYYRSINRFSIFIDARGEMFERWYNAS